MAFLYCQLYILRVMISAANDDEVLDSTGDKQSPVFEKAYISRTQKRPLLLNAQLRMESLRAVIRPSPIPLGDV